MGQLKLTSREEERKKNIYIYSVYKITPKRILSSGLDGLRFGIIKDISVVKKSQSLLKRLADRIGRHSRSDDMNCKRRCCCGSSSFSLFHQSKKHINISISFGQKELHARDNTTRHKGKGRRIGIKRVSQRKEIFFITEKN